ncbi:hypothetical protein [Pedobacter chitinilyticus]|nr:hypothetical protein [Pedobacter chitinilyticus]
MRSFATEVSVQVTLWMTEERYLVVGIGNALEDKSPIDDEVGMDEPMN